MAASVHPAAQPQPEFLALNDSYGTPRARGAGENGSCHINGHPEQCLRDTTQPEAS